MSLIERRPPGFATWPARSRLRGITLIEMLITVLVLAFGLLGLAGLQALSLKNNQSAYFRSQATVLAYEALDRMRADREAALGLNAQVDATDWLGDADAIDRLLPGGGGTVDCTGSPVCIVTITWDDGRGGGEPVAVVVSTQL